MSLIQGSETALGPQAVPPNPIRVLLLDDREENLVSALGDSAAEGLPAS